MIFLVLAGSPLWQVRWPGDPPFCNANNSFRFVLPGSPFIALRIAKGPRHSCTAADANHLSLVLHNVQAQIHLFCSLHKTAHCYAHNPPNVPPVSIFPERNLSVCNLFFATKTPDDILALHQNCLQILCAFVPSPHLSKLILLLILKVFCLTPFPLTVL